MRLDEASAYEDWSWEELFDVWEEETVGTISRWRAEDYWLLKDYILDHSMRLKDLYFEGMARLIWVIQKEHRGTDLRIPWLSPPYGRRSDDEDTQVVTINLPSVLLSALEASAKRQDMEGSTLYYTLAQLEMVRREMIRYQPLELDDEPYEAEEYSGTRYQLRAHMEPEVWLAFRKLALSRRQNTYMLVDEAVWRVLRWYEERDTQRRVPWLNTPRETEQCSISVNPLYKERLLRICDTEMQSAATVVHTALQLYCQREGLVETMYDWAVVEQGCAVT